MNFLDVPLLLLIVPLTLAMPTSELHLSRVRRQTSDDTYKVVCYYPNWSQYRPGDGHYTVDNIDPYLCTHIMYAFAKVQGNNLAPYEANDYSMYTKLMQLKRINPSLKTLLSVGGASAGQVFRNVAATATNREQFATNAVKYVRKYGFDGLDIDWEFPAPADKNSFTELIRAIRDEVESEALVTGQPPLLVTSAFGAGANTILYSYDLPNLAKYLDFATVMTYDLHGGWDSQTGFQAALQGYTTLDQFNVDWVISKYVSLNFPAKKVVVGIPTYGRTFKLCNPSNHGVRDCSNGYGSPGPYTRTGGILAYNEVCQYLKAGWTRQYDVTQANPYAYNGDQWLSYDDKDTVKAKVQYVIKNHLGGVMFWDLSMDDFSGLCNEGKHPLISEAGVLIKAVANSTTAMISTMTTSGVTSTTTRITTKLTTTTPPPPSSTTALPSATSSRVVTTTRAALPSTTRTGFGTTTRAALPSTTRTGFGTTTRAGTGAVRCSSNFGYMEHPTNCSLYFRCVYGQAILMECPKGTYFSMKNKICDWPWAVDRACQ